MKFTKGLAFFSMGAVLTVRGLMPKENHITPNLMNSSEEYQNNFLGTVSNQAIIEATPSSILLKLEDVSNSTTLSSLEDTIYQAKTLNATDLNLLLELLTPPLHQYLDNRNLSLEKALNESDAYMKSSNVTTFQELRNIVDPDTKLMLNLTLDKLAQLKKQQQDLIIPVIIIVVVFLTAAGYLVVKDNDFCKNNDHNDRYALR